MYFSLCKIQAGVFRFYEFRVNLMGLELLFSELFVFVKIKISAYLFLKNCLYLKNKHCNYNLLKEYKNIQTFQYDIWTSFTGGQLVTFRWVGPYIKILTMDRVIHGVIHMKYVNGSEWFDLLINHLIIWCFLN